MDSLLPPHYDVVLSDMTEKILKEEVAKSFGIIYLEESEKRSLECIYGKIWGIHFRIMVPVIMEWMKMKKKVIFLLDTGSPKTFVDPHVFFGFGKELTADIKALPVCLNGHEIVAHVTDPNSLFPGVNVLGADFLMLVGCKLFVDYEKFTAELRGNFKTE